MRLEFLGSGTSFGVPEIGCTCPVCRSPDPHDQRCRCSVWVQHAGLSVVVDTPPDFRLQCLRAGLVRLDAVLITHLHADHIFGLDEIRKFNRLQDAAINVYVPRDFVERFHQIFHYCFHAAPAGITLPRFQMHEVDDAPLAVGADRGLAITPVTINHGRDDIKGYLFTAGGRRIAYLTDCRSVPPASAALVRGVDVLIVGALWRQGWQHPGHLNLEQAIALARDLAAGETFLTHLTHHMGLHAATSAELPPHIHLAYDGLVVEL